jgi:hypothetical protein
MSRQISSPVLLADELLDLISGDFEPELTGLAPATSAVTGWSFYEERFTDNAGLMHLLGIPQKLEFRRVAICPWANRIDKRIAPGVPWGVAQRSFC